MLPVSHFPVSGGCHCPDYGIALGVALEPSIMNDHPPRRLDPHREAKLEALRRALVEGAESGDAGLLDMTEIVRKAREEAGLGPPDA
jgi:hypothetical protein